jgi:hypothetical protein
MKLVFFIFLAICGWLVSAWGEMLTVGVVHAQWWHFVPTMGYHTSLAITAVICVFAFGVGVAGEVAKEAFK